MENEAVYYGQPVLLATRSPGKLRELSALLLEGGMMAETLSDAGIAYSRDEESLEVHETFAQNAMAKARWFAARAGRMVLADDSGLCVDALGGGPGVRSKRWSGRLDLEGDELDAENNRLLVAALNASGQTGEVGRAARYMCAAACAWPAVLTARLSGSGDPDGWAAQRLQWEQSPAVGGGVPTNGLVRTAAIEGVILREPRGNGGFGYDPLFASPALGGRTFAEMSIGEKAAVSHRGLAFARLLESLSALGVLRLVRPG